jgi:nitronate monooxygenase
MVERNLAEIGINLFTETLGVEIPIFQAPTSAIGGPELAAAVSGAGALGGMGMTWTAPETVEKYVRQVRAATSRPFLVSFALAFTPTALPAALDAGAPIISFSLGNPVPYLSKARATGAKVGVQVGNVELAFHAKGDHFRVGRCGLRVEHCDTT